MTFRTLYYEGRHRLVIYLDWRRWVVGLEWGQSDFGMHWSFCLFVGPVALRYAGKVYVPSQPLPDLMPESAVEEVYGEALPEFPDEP